MTGCAGFIGSNFVHAWLKAKGEKIVNLDKLTYAGNPDNLATLTGDRRHIFVHGDITDRVLLARDLEQAEAEAESPAELLLQLLRRRKSRGRRRHDPCGWIDSHRRLVGHRWGL